MFGDYFRSFWRGVLHNKVATLINVGGLAIGLTVFFALTFYVYREFSWDAQWEGADRIFTVAGAQENASGSTGSVLSFAPYVLGTSLQSRRPEAFEAYARLYVNAAGGTISIDGADYPFMPRYHVEAGLLDILQLELVEGSLDAVFANPGSIAINARFIERLFGENSPLGKTITFKPPQNNSNPANVPADFVIAAVYRVPEPSNFATMPFIALLDTNAQLPSPNARLDLWDIRRSQTPPQPGGSQLAFDQPFSVQHYFKLREGVDKKALEDDLRAFMDENRFQDNGVSKTRYLFRNIQDLHLQASPLEVGDGVQRLWVYAAIGTLVLLISGCNFVMLATLRLVDRMREVGIRKSAGAGGGQLLRQYLLDAFLHTLLAAVLAVLFLGFAFPKLSVMLEFPLQLDLLTARNLGLCLAMVGAFTLASSLYPAWMSSQTKPGPLLRNGAGAVVGTGTGLRKLLVCIQFAIVVVLLLASIVVREQIAYTRGRDLGYSTEKVVIPRITGFDMARLPALLTEVQKVPGVDAATVTQMTPGSIMVVAPNPVRVVAPDGSVSEAGLQQMNVGTDFFRTFSVRVLAGREFSMEVEGSPPGLPPGVPAGLQASTGPSSVILNEAAVRQLGFASNEAALDQLLEVDQATVDRQTRKQSLRVIGVVADIQFSTAMLPPVPTYYGFMQLGIPVIKADSQTDLPTLTPRLEAVWDAVSNGVVPFSVLDTGGFAAFQLRREEFEARIITGSAVLAVVIALLGLYGLVAATVIKRVKEIGVRKVMGAERTSIVTLFLWQFSKPIVIANLLAWPFGFWAIRQWLQRFPFQLDTGLILLSGFAASLAALLIAWLTVGVMAARASSVKPVLALRYE